MFASLRFLCNRPLMAVAATQMQPARVVKRRSRRHQSGFSSTTAFDSRKVRTLSREAALNALAADGPMLYAIRLDDGTIIIGRTVDVANRCSYHGGELLAVAHGSEYDEQQLHHQLGAHRVKGKHYRPDPDVLTWINQQRARFGADPVTV